MTLDETWTVAWEVPRDLVAAAHGKSAYFVSVGSGPSCGEV